MLGKKILPTKSTPAISFNPEGIINIRGRSMIGNVTEFSRQIEDWVFEYISDPADLTRVDFYLEYLDGINLRIYISLLRNIASVNLKNKKYIINWHYEEDDEDILEKGEYISSVLNIPFNFIKTYDPKQVDIPSERNCHKNWKLDSNDWK